MPKAYLLLFAAIIAETIGSTAMQASQQFTRLGPSLLVVVGYGTAFYLMAQTLKYMQLGVVYAIWSGLGIVLITGMGWLIFGQKSDLPALIGMAMIIAGILVIHLFSNTASH
ncbi:multidrug efflux SMR transporter [Actibacterium sp.]|uniref:DMT family transporter n=1 Tax=Actibacterium sp. TaxID=1872125 RepID=UPI003562FA00